MDGAGVDEAVAGQVQSTLLLPGVGKGDDWALQRCVSSCLGGSATTGVSYSSPATAGWKILWKDYSIMEDLIYKIDAPFQMG